MSNKARRRRSNQSSSFHTNHCRRTCNTCRSLLATLVKTTMSSGQGANSRGRGRGSTQQAATKGRGASSTRGSGFNASSSRGSAATRGTFGQASRQNANQPPRGSSGFGAHVDSSQTSSALGTARRATRTGSAGDRFKTVSTSFP